MTLANDRTNDHTGNGSGTRNPVLGDRLRELFRRQAAAVSIVTAQGPLGPVGFTATTFTAVSLEPPIVSFCINRASSSWRVLREASHLAVHLLSADQTELARIFATGGATAAEKFAPADCRRGPHGTLLIGGVVAWVVGQPLRRIKAGDHSIVLVEPLDAGHDDGAPLVYHDGTFTRLDQQTADG